MPMTHDRQKSADIQKVGRQKSTTFAVARSIFATNFHQLLISTKWPIRLMMKHSHKSTGHKRAHNKATSHNFLFARRSGVTHRSTRTA